jgi:hypothetical protein
LSQGVDNNVKTLYYLSTDSNKCDFSLDELAALLEPIVNNITTSPTHRPSNGFGAFVAAHAEVATMQPMQEQITFVEGDHEFEDRFHPGGGAA